MKKVKTHLEKKMKDAGFREHYELDLVKLEFIKPIIAYRIKHKLSQTALAKKAGLTQQQISKIENGDFSNFDTILKVFSSIGIEITKVETRQISPGARHRSNQHAKGKMISGSVRRKNIGNISKTGRGHYKSQTSHTTCR